MFLLLYIKNMIGHSAGNVIVQFFILFFLPPSLSLAPTNHFDTSTSTSFLVQFLAHGFLCTHPRMERMLLVRLEMRLENT